ncbi:hypothetical protein IE53DRAFT_51431 [Violaceomyces palustris]|uniref:Uncharacterized protein n=1 Tax=Violaceomyces palustris TaxID=1673888 RepID=A0ACD0NZY7_9BASI|nr:hypothetical protein IE53DRAFT_51431 [Violaceomyces palustris]
MTLMEGDDIQRLWSLVADLSAQLTANRQACEALQAQADQLKGQALHSGTGYALRRFNLDISKEKFESELEQLNAHLVKENQSLAHENKQQALLLKEYENTLETVMSKFRSFSHSTQQHTLRLTSHYETLLANNTHNAAESSLQESTNVSCTLSHLGGLVRQALRSVGGEDTDDDLNDEEGLDDRASFNGMGLVDPFEAEGYRVGEASGVDPQRMQKLVHKTIAQKREEKRIRKDGWGSPRWYGTGGYIGKEFDPEAEKAERAMELLTEEERLRMENETLKELLGLKERSDALISGQPSTNSPSQPLNEQGPPQDLPSSSSHPSTLGLGFGATGRRYSAEAGQLPQRPLEVSEVQVPNPSESAESSIKSSPASASEAHPSLHPPVIPVPEAAEDVVPGSAGKGDAIVSSSESDPPPLEDKIEGSASMTVDGQVTQPYSIPCEGDALSVETIPDPNLTSQKEAQLSGKEEEGLRKVEVINVETPLVEPTHESEDPSEIEREKDLVPSRPDAHVAHPEGGQVLTTSDSETRSGEVEKKNFIEVVPHEKEEAVAKSSEFDVPELSDKKETSIKEISDDDGESVAAENQDLVSQVEVIKTVEEGTSEAAEKSE